MACAPSEDSDQPGHPVCPCWSEHYFAGFVVLQHFCHDTSKFVALMSNLILLFLVCFGMANQYYLSILSWVNQVGRVKAEYLQGKPPDHPWVVCAGFKPKQGTRLEVGASCHSATTARDTCLPGSPGASPTPGAVPRSELNQNLRLLFTLQCAWLVSG